LPIDEAATLPATLLLPLMTVLQLTASAAHVPVVAHAPGCVVHVWLAPGVQVVGPIFA
jgi:hypothetical protein